VLAQESAPVEESNVTDNGRNEQTDEVRRCLTITIEKGFSSSNDVSVSYQFFSKGSAWVAAKEN